MINKILSLILGAIAIIGIPALFGGIFQNDQFRKKLKPALEKEANKTLSDLKIKNASTSLEKLDATISGIALDEESRENARNTVDNLNGIRVKKEDNLIKVINQLNIAKVEKNITFSGLVDNKASTYSNSISKNLNGYTLQHDSIREEEYVLKSDYLDNPSFGKWVTKFIAAPGDRSINVVGQDITLTGQATANVEKKWLSDLSFLGFQPISQLEKIQPTIGNLKITKQNFKVIASGDVSENYPVNKLDTKWDKSITTSPFTEVSKVAKGGAFFAFIGNYFKNEGDRSLELKGNNIHLSGYATPFMNQRWMRNLNSLGFNTKNNLELFPSPLHFPNYKVMSNLSEVELKRVSNALTGCDIYFDLGKSDVREDQLYKVETIATIIKSTKNNANFALGGHTDSTGNAEFNKKLSSDRAQSVINLLKQKGINPKSLSIVTFGSTKSSSSGDPEKDRKVQTLIK